VSDRIQILGFKGKCVEAPELQNGTTLVMRTCTGEKKQEWIPRNSGELVSAENTNFCIDLAGPSNDNGADAQVWRCNGNCRNNQGWFFDRTASGHKRLISQYNSKCVDIKDNSTAEGAPLQMWVCNNSENKSFVSQKKYGSDAEIDTPDAEIDTPDGSPTIPQVIAGSCSASDLLPEHQLYSNARDIMSGESGVEFSLPSRSDLGIVVIDTWIRGPTRQTLWVDLNPAPLPLIRPKAFDLTPDSNRGSSRTFNPRDSRAMIVLDYIIVRVGLQCMKQNSEWKSVLHLTLALHDRLMNPNSVML